MIDVSTPAAQVPEPARPPFWQRAAGVIARFLQPPQAIHDFPFADHELEALHHATRRQDDGAIDAQTWRDLHLAKYAATLAQGRSIFGQQAIQRRLRQCPDETELARAQQAYRQLAGAPLQRQMLGKTLEPLRRLEEEVSGLVFQPVDAHQPWWLRGIWLYRALGVLAIGGAISNSLAWLLGLAGIIVLFFLLQATWFNAIELFDRKLKSLRIMCRTALELAKAGQPGFDALRADIAQLSSGLSRSRLEAAVPGLMLYMDWFLLSNIKHHFRAVAVLRRHQDSARRCYELLAELEADLAVAEHLAQGPRICWAERCANGSLELAAMVHPLLPGAQALSISLQGRGAFLSGQNGIGKSTLLRTAGLNLVVGRGLGFCYASRALIPAAPVYTSIQIEDSMAGGESLYLAELRRGREMLASSRAACSGVYLIDEIFRGTNHVESVAAAAAVVDALAQSALVIVSSHNLVLAAILQRQLQPLRVQAGDAGLQLEPGVLAQPNGLALLASTGFDASICANAGTVAQWLSGYLAHPKECPDLFAAQGLANR
ncbi:hypothetical protein [Duganella sp. Root1480D1]|uniref:MutS-related protein n=1 Tax=Duganella sp. Root1480D1 TaxID=1736471 RepID=UPI0007110920|nr:hypothetical protein [Duganella sp. Root1480D1]KQZ42250.1 hypothetical protein ASD58_25635 [Duganella sp. Root1480D1]